MIKAAPTRAALRRHWPAFALLLAGFALRLLAAVTYRPAVFYIDTIRYLYNSGGNDPVGYRLPLRLILAVGNFDLVAIVQHVLGLAMAVTIYLLLGRRGAPRWLAALAVAPVLLDAYQIQMEQMILPDVWFEALIVAGLAALLNWGRAGPPATRLIVAGGLILGISATFRQVGEILIVPALLYVVVSGGGPRAMLTRCAALAAAFALPIIVYMTGSYLLVGHFYLSHSGVTTTYGRLAASADCATLKLPRVERPLCPTPEEQARGPDWLEHGTSAPIRRYYTGPLSSRASKLVASFNDAVLSQQAGRVAGSYARDVIRLFALSKVSIPGDTPVGRWQFQARYPYLSPHATLAQVLPAVAAYGGGRPAVWGPGAAVLRGYQLGGGYTPGPLLALFAAAGLIGSVLMGSVLRGTVLRGTVLRGTAPTGLCRDRGTRDLLASCLLFFCSGAALLLMSDVFEFSWRYQLPALVTLPPAGIAALAALARRRTAASPDLGSHGLPQASEEVRLRD